ncbi:MAG: SDR family oxidoreductase [Halobacteriales archaeon]
MADLLLTGATGVLGQALRSHLLESGHDVRAASRSPPADGEGDWIELDLTDGTGLLAALSDVEVVVHAASNARGDSEAVDVRGTERLVQAAEGAGIENLLYVSIVGIDEIPFSYYQHKLAAERAIESSPVPSTIIRSTQFHPFVAAILHPVSRLPVWPLPTAFKVQPIDPGEAAAAITEHATVEAAGRVPDIGGPTVMTGRELATAYRGHRDLRRPIIRLPLPGGIASAFRAGKATCPDRAVGTVTWEDWLEAQAGVPGRDAY